MPETRRRSPVPWPALVAAASGALTSAACVAASPTAASGGGPRILPAALGEPAPVNEAPAVTGGLAPGAGTVAVVGATVLVGDGRRIERGAVVFTDGRLVAVGPASEVEVPEGARRVEATARFVTPGLIDTHSHLGVYAQPSVAPHADGNEMTDPTTPYVFSEHAFWPQDPAIDDAIAGGVTTIQVLPGSGNVIGGRSTVLKLRPRREARAMRFPGAPDGLKMACGENPKRVYGGKGRQPMSRMGSVYQLRAAFIDAREYADARARYAAAHAAWEEELEAAKKSPSLKPPGPEPKPPPRDLGMETLAEALAGEILVHIHCYRADEMLLMLALGDELGFRIASFHHATEAYKIADVLAERSVGASVWADWWGFKLEAYDAVEENAAMVAAAGGIPVIHSDSPIGIQRLNQEAAKALFAGRRLGLALSEDEAIRWVTQNPARVLGIDDRTGTLEVGKMADVVVWDRDPLSIYARADLVFVDGVLVHDRSRPFESASDFDVGAEVEVKR